MQFPVSNSDHPHYMFCLPLKSKIRSFSRHLCALRQVWIVLVIQSPVIFKVAGSILDRHGRYQIRSFSMCARAISFQCVGSSNIASFLNYARIHHQFWTVLWGPTRSYSKSAHTVHFGPSKGSQIQITSKLWVHTLILDRSFIKGARICKIWSFSKYAQTIDLDCSGNPLSSHFQSACR